MIRWALKIVHEWNGHLENFSQVKENSRQNLLLRTDILQKTVIGCPWPELWKTTIGLIAAHFFVHFLAADLHDYNVKRPETSWFSRFIEETWYMFLFTFSTADVFFFSSAIKFVSVRWSWGKLDLFENYKGFNIFFPIDWPRSNSTIPPIASDSLSRGRGR